MASETSGSPQPQASSETPERADGWHVPQPVTLPGPTYVPAVMGFGVFFLFWGLATSLYISGVGLGLTVFALVQWIGELRRGT
jgi:hypothetical protein